MKNYIHIIFPIVIFLFVLTGCDPRVQSGDIANPPKPKNHRSLVRAWNKTICESDPAGQLLEAFKAGVFDAGEKDEANVISDCAFGTRQSSAKSSRSKTYPNDDGMNRLSVALSNWPIAVSARDLNSRGLLHLIVEKDNIRLLTVISDLGLLKRMSWADSAGKYPIHYANSEESSKILWASGSVEWVESQMGIPPTSSNFQDFEGLTPLAEMARRGNGRAVTFVTGQLCRQSAHWITRNTLGVGRWAEDRYLGNTINQADLMGRTALTHAVIANDLLSVDSIISCPSTIYGEPDKQGKTALHYAAIQKDFAVGYALLVRGTRGLDEQNPVAASTTWAIDAQDSNGDTALHIAYRCGNLEAIEILQRFSADHTIKNARGQIASDPDSIKLTCRDTVSVISSHLCHTKLDLVPDERRLCE